MTDNPRSSSSKPVRKLVPIAVKPRDPTPAEAIRNIFQNPLISVRLSKQAHAYMPQPVGGDVIAPDTLLFELDGMLGAAECKLIELAKESQRLGVAAERSDDRTKGLNLISALRQWVLLTAASRPPEVMDAHLQEPLVIPPEIERQLQELAVLGDRLAAWWRDAAARFAPASAIKAGEVSPTAVGPSELARFRFVRQGKTWNIAFGEETGNFPCSKGLGFIHELIRNEGRPVDSVQLAGGGDARSGDEAVDFVAREGIRRRAVAIAEEVKQHRAARREEKVNELLTELKELEKYTRKGKGKGRARKLGNEGNRMRQSVGLAIKRALQRMEGEMPKLAAHLHASIATPNGYKPCYQPTSPCQWLL